MKSIDVILKDLPDLYSSEDQTMKERVVYHRFGTLFNEPEWRWNVLEGQKEGDDDILFFGYVQGLSNEFGYFRYSELQLKKGNVQLIEQSDPFEPIHLVELYTNLASWDDEESD